MTLDELKKEKARIKVKLDLIQIKYEDLKLSDEEYEDLKNPLITQLKDIELQIKEETEDDTLTDNEQEYADLMAAEAGIQNDFIAWFMYSIIILVIGFIISVPLNQLSIGMVLSGLMYIFAGFKLTGITIAWGIIHAKKCELAESIR